MLSAEQSKYFSRISVFLDTSSPVGAFDDIIYEAVEKSPTMSDDESDFYLKCETLKTRIKNAFAGRGELLNIKRKLLNILANAAAVGLAGPDPNVKRGQDAFKACLEQAVFAANESRKQRINSIAFLNLPILTLAAVSALSIDYGAVSSAIQVYQNFLTYMCGISYGFCGASAGSILWTYISNSTLNNENFDKISVYNYTPLHSTVFFLILCLVFMLLIGFTKVFQIGVGGELLNDWIKNPRLGFVCGLVCVISEPLVSSILSRIQPTLREQK